MARHNLQNQPDEAEASFEVESAILKEMGEQMFGSSETALTELIKNSYDADATQATLEWSDSMIILTDDGHGMREDEFLNAWMNIGTSNKIYNSKSRKYGRDLTGSKGVGRFAVRFLGETLDFISVAETTTGRTKLSAMFHWPQIDKETDVKKVRIRYRLERDVSDPVGTRLKISDLKHTDDFGSSVRGVRTNLLNIETPLIPLLEDLGLKEGKRMKSDPGFNFIDRKLNGSFQQGNIGSLPETDAHSLASTVLGAFLARIEVRYSAKIRELRFILTHKDRKEEVPFKTVFAEDKVGSDIVADIRFLPRRKGVFSSLNGLDGRRAYGWVKDHCGIGVYDRGFRIPPYGYGSNDWLYQDFDQASSRRDWRSDLMQQHFPMEPEIRSTPRLNYMLNLPKTTQVIGVVFVESDRKRDDQGLTPNMDRQGFKINAAYLQMVEIIRAAMEYMAMEDKRILLKKEAEENQRRKEETRADIKKAIKLIKETKSLTPEDKARVVDQYQYLSRNIEDLESYDREARESLEIMSLMGVIAGFMTHEYQSAIDHLERVSDLLGELGKKDKRFLTYKEGIDKNMAYFVNYIEYTKAFVTSLNRKKDLKFKALPRIQHVVDTFGGYCDDNSILVNTSDIDDGLEGPRVPLALYQGVIQNLFTNAIKALISERNDSRQIRFIAWNEEIGKRKRHIIQVMDNGPGIPDALRNRIWDPLFTTSSNENNPLGSGMGLGLSLLRKAVKQHKGVIDLKEPPHGFATCFQVELPFGR